MELCRLFANEIYAAKPLPVLPVPMPVNDAGLGIAALF